MRRASRSTDRAPRGGRRDACRRFVATVPVGHAVARRSGDGGDDDGIESVCTDVPDGAPPPRRTQRRTRHRRVTTVSSTGSFRRRRVGAIAAAPAQHARTQRHRSVPREPRVLRQWALATLARGLISSGRGSKKNPLASDASAGICAWSSCACTDGPGMESELISSTARARQGARRKERVSRWQMGRLLGADRSPARAANVGRSLHGHELAGLGSPSASPPWRARFKARGERGAQIEGKWKDCCEQICPPTRLEPAAAGRRRARACGGERGLDKWFE